MAAGDPVLDIRGLKKVYPDGTEALAGIDLQIERGETVALLGSNGSGKSTLMRCALGLEHATAGRVRLHGIDVTSAKRRELRSARRRTGMVFQSINLVDTCTVLTNVVHGTLGTGQWKIRRWSQTTAPDPYRAAAMDALQRVGLDHLAARRADQLSGGQRQRVALARMLVQDPEVVLADEPVASLDPKSGHEVMDLMMEISRERGFTVVVTLHQLELALSHSDRLVGLRRGQIELDRPTASMDEAQLRTLYAEDAPDRSGQAGAPIASGNGSTRAGFDPEAAGLPGRWGIVDPREINPVHRIRKASW
jgi:phosphonate transport system ATP-binding protein